MEAHTSRKPIYLLATIVVTAAVLLSGWKFIPEYSVLLWAHTWLGGWEIRGASVELFGVASAFFLLYKRQIVFALIGLAALFAFAMYLSGPRSELSSRVAVTRPAAPSSSSGRQASIPAAPLQEAPVTRPPDFPPPSAPVPDAEQFLQQPPTAIEPPAPVVQERPQTAEKCVLSNGATYCYEN